MNLIDKVAWIEVQNKKVLSTKSFGKDKYYIPGGKREKDETDEQTLIREIHEELDVMIHKESIKFFGIFEAQAHGHPDGVWVKMTCFTADFSGELSPKSEIEQIKWLSFAEKEIISEVDKLIFDQLKVKNLID